MIRALRRRLHGDDDGMTLIELVVAMGVFALLLTLVVSMFVSTARAFSDERGAVDNSRLASTSMNEVTRIVRAGTEIPVWGSAENDPVFVSAGAEQLTLNAFIDAGTSDDPPPVRVRFARNGQNELTETRWSAYHDHTTYWKFQTTSTYARLIARSLLPPDPAAPLFRYYDADGTELVPPRGGSLSVSQIRNIASVQITMQVQGDGSGRVDPVEIRNMVGLPNLGVARVEVH
ncbi:PulJ/GspJ family protein [Microbacterium luticocti]|uniref:PulJ/GspJ family protein n=1 Tax=Microbacterium luticocti TaxID=451764 RepID=UPI000414283B|nr:prepilin-type N-terminal cleavage/methylation domain-containing protein [Microbacterium luticocti]